jgi:Glycosyl transferase family 2
MKIYAISLIKNEADIIEKNLTEASKWCNKIYVYDNGSTDGTWKIVNKIKSDIIIPYKTEALPYRDSLRQEVFQHFRHELSEGDWVCFKLDADEFYIDNPRVFLSKLKYRISLIYGVNIQYEFTEDNINDSDNVFSFEKFKYALVAGCEERFIKYRKNLIWLPNGSLPSHPGVSSEKLIKFAHYQFRSSEQIIKRLNTRKEALESGYKMYWENDLKKTWESKIIDKSKLIEITPDTNLDLLVKSSKISIPETKSKRILKRIMHGFHIWP